MGKTIPMRLCVGCNEMREKNDLMRVVKATDGTFCLDFKGKMNGRGAYICKNKDCLLKACKNKGLERSFKMSIPAELTEALLKEFEVFE